MDLNNITAENMRKLSKGCNGDIKGLLTLIRKKAEKGKTNLHLSDYAIKTSDREELERRGFVVKIGGRFNEIHTYIGWD